MLRNRTKSQQNNSDDKPENEQTPKRRAFLKRIAKRITRRKVVIPEIDFSKPLRILIVTDAWKPQVNGVVRTLETLGEELTKHGHEVRYLEPSRFKTVPMPSYPEIRLSLFAGKEVRRTIREYLPNAIHIATEGPLGWAARNYCVRKKIAFTTSFHTRFPEYIHARWRLPMSWSYAVLRWFHGRAQTMMVATDSLREEMEARGFPRLKIWSRGVDLAQFSPGDKDWLDFPRPIWLHVGRVAIEKNIEAFLKMNVDGTKVVVGDGPQTEELTARYPEAKFVGPKFGEELAKYYAASDVFVFPSKTDTFGLVQIEALASGIPVAAYPVKGPLDVIGDAPVGVLDEDLERAAKSALNCATPEECREYANLFSWEACSLQFLSNLTVDEDNPPPLDKLEHQPMMSMPREQEVDAAE